MWLGKVGGSGEESGSGKAGAYGEEEKGAPEVRTGWKGVAVGSRGAVGGGNGPGGDAVGGGR